MIDLRNPKAQERMAELIKAEPGARWTDKEGKVHRIVSQEQEESGRATVTVSVSE